MPSEGPLPASGPSSSASVEAMPLIQADSTPNSRVLRKRRLDLNKLSSGLSPSVCQWQYCGVAMKHGESLEWHYQGHLEHELGRLNRGVRIKKHPGDFPDRSSRRRVRDSAVERIKFRREARRAGLRASEEEEGHSRRLRCPVCQLVVVQDEEEEANVVSEHQSQGSTSLEDRKTDISRMQENCASDKQTEIASASSEEPIAGPSTSFEDSNATNSPSCSDNSMRKFLGHVSECLRTIDPGEASEHVPEEETETDEELVDIDGREYEEYTWAGQTRVRATSLIEGGLRDAPGFLTIQRGDEDEELDVMNDVEEQRFGGAQFGDADVVPPSQTAEEEELREAVLGKSKIKEAEKYEDIKVVEDDNSKTREDLLRENQDLRKLSLCNVCMDSYRSPCVAVSCWHVHCQECWLRALGAKKLCPQCKVIVTPKDLRRIYL